MKRNRIHLSLALLTVITLGLASRKYPALFPALLGKYPGDSLWSLMVYLAWGFIKPHFKPLHIAALAFATSCLVEFSQLYQAPWINAIRHTTLGHLVLGSTFSWLDMVAYVVGVLCGLLIEYIFISIRLINVSAKTRFKD